MVGRTGYRSITSIAKTLSAGMMTHPVCRVDEIHYFQLMVDFMMDKKSQVQFEVPYVIPLVKLLTQVTPTRGC